MIFNNRKMKKILSRQIYRRIWPDFYDNCYTVIYNKGIAMLSRITDWMKGLFTNYNGGLVPQPPGGFNALRAKACEKGAVHYAPPPCLSHQLQRSGCFPAEPYPLSWQGKNIINFINKEIEILNKNEIVLNTETTFMVKPDKSRATKTGHFYLSLT